MTHITYKVVRHEDGWAYMVNGAFSESFPTHEEALDAARRASAEQRKPGHTRIESNTRTKRASGTRTCARRRSARRTSKTAAKSRKRVRFDPWRGAFNVRILQRVTVAAVRPDHEGAVTLHHAAPGAALGILRLLQR